MAGNLFVPDGTAFIQEVLITGFEPGVDLDAQYFYLAPHRYFGLLDANKNEITGTGYQRIQVTSWTGETYEDSHAVKNGASVTWTSQGGWPTVHYIGLYAQNAAKPLLIAQITPKDMSVSGTQLMIPIGGAIAYFACKSSVRNSHFTLEASKSLASLVSKEQGGTYNLKRFCPSPAPGNLMYKAKLIYSGANPIECNESNFSMSPVGGDKLKPNVSSLTFYNSGTQKQAVALVYTIKNSQQGADVDVISIPINVTHPAGATLTFNQGDLEIAIS